MKKLLSLFLAMTLALSLAPCAFADGSDNNFALQEPALQIYSCLTEGYGAKNTEVLYDNEKIVISINIDGFSASFDEYSNSNGQANKALMDSTKANFISLSQLFSAIVANAGFPDAHIYLYLKDDLNEDDTILALLDGELKYDQIEDASSSNSVPTATDVPVEDPTTGEHNDATVVAEEGTPILFRDIEWGVSLPEALQGMPEGVKFYNMDADSSYTVEGAMLDEHKRFFDGHVVGYISSRSSTLEEVKVAGYELSRITMRFAFDPNEEGVLVEDGSHTKLYYAEYEINPKDYTAAYEDLTAKLSSLYGVPVTTKYSDYVIGEKYTVWNGADNTMLVLFGGGPSASGSSIEIRYGTTDGNEWLQQAYDALVKQESISAASNMDGL